jgi:hypothetical protein
LAAITVSVASSPIFFQNGIIALGKQARDIRGGGVAAIGQLARFDHGSQAF